jgi:peptide/nickel transport system permease protein
VKGTFWWFFRIAITCIYVAVLFAPFLAPYPPNEQNRDLPAAPPTPIRLLSLPGGFIHPVVYRQVEWPPASRAYHEDRSTPFPIHFFARTEPYRLAGLTFTTRFFAVDKPASIFLLGSDEYGRDVLSRLLHGGRVSLLLAPIATMIALSLGLVIGGVAGYFGGKLDMLITAVADCFLSVPWVYLILTIRASLPLELGSSEIFVFLTLVLGLAGWARPARLVRGVVLSAKERSYVLAARSFGASDVYLLWKHVLPQTKYVLRGQLALLIPSYLLAEASLSFFGLGFTEPVVSWGSLLGPLQRYSLLISSWWLWLPAAFLVFTVGCFHGLLHTSTRQERLWISFR